MSLFNNKKEEKAAWDEFLSDCSARECGLIEESDEARNCRTCFFYCTRETSLKCKKRVAACSWVRIEIPERDEDLIREMDRERFGRQQTAWVTGGHEQ